MRAEHACSCCSGSGAERSRGDGCASPQAPPSEAYRLLFPLGLLHVLVAVGLWFLQGIWAWPQIAATVHVHLVLQGFFGGFVAGFLMTMAPRMLGAPAPSGAWRWALAAVMLFGAIAVLGGWSAAAPLAMAAIFLIVLGFALRCLVLGERLPPPRMVLAGIALLGGAGASAVLACEAAGAWLPLTAAWGAREIATQGVLLLLVCAIAPFLLPQLALGAAPRPGALFMPAPRPRRYLSFAAAGVLLLLSFPLHAEAIVASGVDSLAARSVHLLRFVLVLLLLAPAHVLLRRSRYVPGYLRIAAWSLLSVLAGVGLSVLWPEQVMAWKHLIFVTGFLLLTLVVGARVLTAHAGRDGDLEHSGHVLVLIAGLVAVAGAARIGAEWTDSRLLHLALAAGFASIALLIWSVRYAGLVWVRVAAPPVPAVARQGAPR